MGITSLATEADDETKEIDPVKFIKTESNFVNLPFFALSRQDAAQKTKTEYRVSLKRDGQQLDASWKVTANTEHGYPGPFDRKVHKAIEYIINEQGIPVENPIAFALHQLAQLIGVSWSGKTATEIREALRRIVHTAIDSEGIFWSKTRREFISDSFHLYDRVVFKEQTLTTGDRAETNYLFLSAWYIHSLNGFYTRPIDYEFLRRIQSDVAGRLYELLGLKFFGVFQHKRASWRIAYQDLCDLLPIRQQRYYSKARSYLKPAHQELIDTGFLASVEWEKESRHVWSLRYYPGQRARDEFSRVRQALGDHADQIEMPLRQAQAGEQRDGRLKNPHTPAKSEDAISGQGRGKNLSERENTASTSSSEVAQTTKLASLLIERGIKPRAAGNLAKKYPSRIERNLEVFDFLLQRPDHGIKDPPAYLVRAVQENWFITSRPKGFVSQEEQHQQRQQQAEAAQELAREYEQQKQQLIEDVEAVVKLAPAQRVASMLAAWETTERKLRRAPSPEERAQRQDLYVGNLPSKEKLLSDRIRELQTRFEEKARGEGIEDLDWSTSAPGEAGS